MSANTNSNTVAQTAVSIDISCEGDFVIDAVGIRSLAPIDYESATWEGTELTLKGKQFNNVVSIGKYSGFSVGNVSGSHITVGNVTYGGGQPDSVMIDGVRYSRDTAAAPSTKKLFSVTWEERGIINPVLNSVDLSGNATLDISIPLDDDCDIDCCGATAVVVHGDNPTTTLDVSISGASKIAFSSNGPPGTVDKRHPGIVNKLDIGISGAGKAYGFHSLKQVKINVSGAGVCHGTHAPGCKVKQHTSGAGSVSLHKQNLIRAAPAQVVVSDVTTVQDNVSVGVVLEKR